MTRLLRGFPALLTAAWMCLLIPIVSHTQLSNMPLPYDNLRLCSDEVREQLMDSEADAFVRQLWLRALDRRQTFLCGVKR